MKGKKVKIYIDGGSRGNPGPSACAAVIMDEKDNVIAEEGRFLGKTTNNVAEYSALHLALTCAASLKSLFVEIYSDSQLLVKQFYGEYAVKDEKLSEMMKVISKDLKKFKEVKIFHIKRGKNKLADKLVNSILDSKKLPEIENLKIARERKKSFIQDDLF